MEKTCQVNGEEETWKLLDEKYLPQTIDLHRPSTRIDETLFHLFSRVAGETGGELQAVFTSF